MLKNHKEIVKNNDFIHKYIYDENGDRAGVIVVVKTEKGKFKNYSGGYSICSKKEKAFNKDIGKAIAILRANSEKADFDKVPDKFKDQVIKKFSHMLANRQKDF